MENSNSRQPLLVTTRDEPQLQPHGHDRRPPTTAIFSADVDDIHPITGPAAFSREFWIEFKKLWYLAGPAIFISVCKYSLGAVTQVFAGHVGTIELAAVSVENSVIAGFSYGVMLGMGSALETLCGQAYGAGQVDMLGVYMQRSWVILIVTAMMLSLLYIFADPILRGIGQTDEISEAAGRFAIWMIPQLFAYALNFPVVKFLQAQSKFMVIAWISAVALVVHVALSWLLMMKLQWGLAGAAVALNSSWWLIGAVQLWYALGGRCGRAWAGFSWQAFENLWAFVRLSLASAVMLCLEMWYFMVLILFAGYLKDAEVAVGALSVSMNLLGWTIMVSIGMNVAVSVRVSNELGALHPRTAKFSVVVAVITSTLIGLSLALLLVISRDDYPSLFSNDTRVQRLVKVLTPLTAVSIIINNVQPVLSGVAIGAGWQALVAYVNISCYYLFGIPVGLILCYKFNLGVMGIWYGMISGTIVQTCVLFVMIYRTNWNKEASLAEDRINKWGGHKDIEDKNGIH